MRRLPVMQRDEASGSQKWGFLDEAGALVIPFRFERVTDFLRGLAVFREAGRAGAVDLQGEVVIPAEFDHISNF